MKNIDKIKDLLQSLNVEELNEILNVVLPLILEMGNEREKSSVSLKDLNDTESTPVAQIEDYRNPIKPVSLSDYRKKKGLEA